jgi:hypothetical protein
MLAMHVLCRCAPFRVVLKTLPSTQRTAALLVDLVWNHRLLWLRQAVQRLLGVDACELLRAVTIIVAIEVWKVLQSSSRSGASITLL